MKYFDLKKTFMDLRDAWAKKVPYSTWLPPKTSEKEPVVATPEKLKAVIDAFYTGKNYSYKRRKQIYMKHLKEKYGKGLS